MFLSNFYLITFKLHKQKNETKTQHISNNENYVQSLAFAKLFLQLDNVLFEEIDKEIDFNA